MQITEILKIVFPALMVLGALGSAIVNVISKGDNPTTLQWIGAALLYTALMLRNRAWDTNKERSDYMSKYAIELNNINEVKDFTEAVSKVESDVRLIGKDENGRDWELSAKSLLCSLLMSAKLQRNREHTAHDVDWNTLWCVCDEDIYSLISKYVK